MPTITIHSIPFTLDPPFAEGHTLTSGEAKVLNDAWVLNLRKNFAVRIKRLHDEAAMWPPSADAIAQLQARFAEYAANYALGATPTKTQIDPVLREARKMARARVLAKLREVSPSTQFSEEEIEAHVSDVLSRYPSFMEEARKRVDALQSVALSALEL